MRIIKQLLDAFRRSVRPPARLSPSEWASGRVVIADGLTPKYQIENAPWQREPLDTVANADAKEVVYLAPVGTGKTTFMEAALAYLVAEDPGPTLLVGQTDDDLKDWAETRMDYVIRNTPETAALLPEDRHKKRKMVILFPHMSLFLTGANLSGLQSKSMRRVFGDEAWMWKTGMMQEARGRLHDRWNRQIFFLSQAGIQGDDLDKAWQETDQREFMFTCPCCGREQPWRQANLIMDEIEDMLAKAQTARIRCEDEECNFVIRDNPVQRRGLAESARYVATKQGMPGHIGYHYNALCNWRLPLWEIALKFLQAKAAVSQGNLDPLRQYVQKRLAEAWVEDLTDNRRELVGDGYQLSEFSNGEPIEDELFRFMAVDVQRDHFWVVLRAWQGGEQKGGSKLLYFGRVETFDQVDELQAKFRVPPKMVFVDAQYEKDRVYSACASRDWTALHGSRLESFPHRRQDGSLIRRPFSKFSDASAANGKRVRFAYWSSDRAKDIVHALRVGKGAPWMVPDDAPKEYLRQIDSEQKREVVSPITRQTEYRWVKVRKDNHAWDCEAMQVVAALMLRLLPGFDD
jgi:hypothetical protein